MFHPSALRILDEKMIDDFLSNPNGVFGAILLACFGAWLTYRTVHRGRRAAACSAFRAAVLAELGPIYPNASSWPANIDSFLRSRFPALQTAVETFRPFVPWWKRWLFERAWFRYRCATGRKIDVQCYHHYVPIGDNPNYKANFQGNVSALLSFADET
ncbi:hypothetical protein [Methylomonas koyamae]|uniref:hypothetical protein n=2 Tax=Methylomonas koyamae TaxID=702114 RepID=UPI00210FA752|nr:hypothetical protein [Methylomonas koyamae]